MRQVAKTRFFLLTLYFLMLIGTMISCHNKENETQKNELTEEHDEYDGPDKAAEFEMMRTKDPAIGYVPIERLIVAKEETMFSKVQSPFSLSGFGNWEERGPMSDVTGPSNGNTRANSGITAGRIRAVLVDKADATGKTVIVAGVDGGLWKTTDITTNPAGWTPVNDFLTNLSVSDITQDPTNLDVMYFCTGESFNNADAVGGVGVFKSTDHGITWNLLASTTSYTLCSRIVCDASGNIYLGTFSFGLLRSIDGGATWTGITPTGSSSRIADVEISSTGRLHVTTGLGNSAIGVYRFTDIPSTVTTTTWTSATTAFPYPSGANCRVELGCKGNTLYALPSNTSAQVATIYKSSDGGVTWAATGTQPTAGWASGQAWYALAADVNPADANQCIVGGLDNYKTTDGGATWTQLSAWVGLSGQYVHADEHKILWYDNGNKLLFACDGGIHYSADGGTTIRDRNTGLRIKQFYSCAAHPTSLNYFLAGAQDNGTHQFNNAGLSNTIEITGGDGAFTAIDQNEPAYQFGAYVYTTFRRSVNSGAGWSSINFYTGTNVSPVNFGNFINPFALDNSANVMYAASTGGQFFRWTNPQTQASGSYYASGTPAWPATASLVSLTALNSATVLALTVSPYTADRVYFGTSGGRVCYADGASTIASGSAGTNISTGLPAASVSCIATGTNDNNLMVCYTNYGVVSIWVSSNAGVSWTSIEGNLPDMPVRWCMFAPGDNSKAIIATETGVWFTQSINGGSTVWTSSPGFPAVRTDMLQYRSTDGMVVAATHGRGLWTQTAASILPLNNFTLRGRWTGNTADLNWTYESLPVGATMEVESSTDAINFNKIGSLQKSTSNSYSFKYNPATGQNLYFRIKAKENTGAIKYSNIVKLFKTGNGNSGQLVLNKFYPNPAKDMISIAFNAPQKGEALFTITNFAGQKVWSKKEIISLIGSYTNTENIENLKSGSYIFTISLNGKNVSQTFIKQ